MSSIRTGVGPLPTPTSVIPRAASRIRRLPFRMVAWSGKRPVIALPGQRSAVVSFSGRTPQPDSHAARRFPDLSGGTPLWAGGRRPTSQVERGRWPGNTRGTAGRWCVGCVADAGDPLLPPAGVPMARLRDTLNHVRVLVLLSLLDGRKATSRGASASQASPRLLRHSSGAPWSNPGSTTW